MSLRFAYALAFSVSVALSAVWPNRQPSTVNVERLRWMAGCWEQRAGASVTQEAWLAPAGGAMVGMSRTVAGGAMRAWEALRVAIDRGRLAYVAQPNGKTATAFPAVVTTDTLAVFENLAHGFPQRIAYRRLSADSIVARISAVRDGTTRGTDIRMQRVSCGG